MMPLSIPRVFIAAADRTGLAHRVEDVEVVVVAHRLEGLGVDILAESGVVDRRFDIVGGQGVAGHQGVAETVFDQPLHGRSGVLVEGHRRAEHPDDMAVPAIVFEDFVEGVVGVGKGRLPGTPGAEGEFVGIGGILFEAPLMDENAFLAVLGPAGDHHIALFQAAGLNHLDAAVSDDKDRVHPALRGKDPALNRRFYIFRVVGGGMVVVRGDAVGGAGSRVAGRTVFQRGCVKSGGV